MNEATRVKRRIRRAYRLGRGPACLYLLHFVRPFGHARHYLGYTGRATDLDERLACHRSGRGSALVRAALAAGIDFECVLTLRIPLQDARTIERRLKNNGASTRLCPLCLTATRAARASAARARYARLKGVK